MQSSKLKINLPTTVTNPAFLSNSMFRYLLDSVYENKDVEMGNGYPVTDTYYDDEKEEQNIEMALAGFNKSDINVNISSNKITIESSGVLNKNKSGRKIARRSFKRVFVDYNNKFSLKKAKAQFKNGLLSVVIPLKKESKSVSIDIE